MPRWCLLLHLVVVVVVALVNVLAQLVPRPKDPRECPIKSMLPIKMISIFPFHPMLTLNKYSTARSGLLKLARRARLT